MRVRSAVTTLATNSYQLHHMHFECNYGAMHFPIDKWLGTFAAGKKGVAESMLEETGHEHSVHSGKQQ